MKKSLLVFLIKCGLLSFCICAITLSPFTLLSQDWNNCGKNALRNGLSPIPGPDGPTILWQGTEPGLFGFPVMIEGNILVTSRFTSLNYSPVVCHDINTGQILWIADVTNGTGRSIPIGIRNGKVYVMKYLEGSSGDTLVALDAVTGGYLWTAENLIRPATMIGCVFTDNGDLIVEGNLELLRIDGTNGNTIWNATAIPWVVGWLCPVIFGNSVYVQQNALESITAFDLNTGTVKYAAAIDPLGGNGQTGLMVDSDGTLYTQTTGIGGKITALHDDGSSLTTLWSTPAGGYSVFCYMAEGPDSAIYVPANGKIMRLLKTTGDIIDSSDLLGSPSLFIASVSVGSDGKVYIATENTFQCANADLTTVFTETISNINTSGCALGPKNTLAISGGGNELRVYQNIATEIFEPETSDSKQVTLYPNPARDILILRSTEVIKRVECMNTLRQFVPVTLKNNSITVSDLPTGLYLLRITTEDNLIIAGKFIRE